MRKKQLEKEDYMSLLEQAVLSGPIPSGPMGQRTSKAPVAPEGVRYRGITLGGDRILDWEGREGEQQFTHYHAKDIDDIVKKVSKHGDEPFDDEEDDDEVSLAEIDTLLEDDDEEVEEEDEDEEEDEEEDEDEDEEESGDIEVKENLNFTTKETEILNRLIQEMSLLEDVDENEEDEEEDEDEEESRGTPPDLDLDEEEEEDEDEDEEEDEEEDED